MRAPGYICSSLPASKKIRVSTYVRKDFTELVSFRVLNFSFDSLLVISFEAISFCLVRGWKEFILTNVYNTPSREGMVVAPERLFHDFDCLSFVCGDFNVHTIYTDPLKEINPGERRLGELFFRVATVKKHTIINEPGIHTRFPNRDDHRPSCIDYTLANNKLLHFVDDWNHTLDSTGSDHIAIITTINSREIRTARPAPDWEEIQWYDSEGKTVEHLANPLTALALTQECHESMRNLPGFGRTTSAQEADEVFTQNFNTLVAIVRNTAPMKRPTRWLKA